MLKLCRVGCNLAVEMQVATLLAVISTAKNVEVAVIATAKSVAVAVNATAKSVAEALNCYSQMCQRVCKMSQLL